MQSSGPSVDDSHLGRHGVGAAIRHHPWRLVALLAAICFLGHFNREGMAIAADMRIMAQYDISPVQMGTVYSAFLAAYTLAMIPGGWVIDRFGPRLALAVVCLGSALFVALTGAVGLVVVSGAAAFSALLWIRGLMGAVSAPLHPASANAVALGVPALRRSAANGIVTGASLLGVAATYLVLGRMIEVLDWTWAIISAAAVTAALGLVWLRYAGTAVARRSDASPGYQPAASAAVVATSLDNHVRGPAAHRLDVCASQQEPVFAHAQLRGRRLLSISVLLLDALLL